jgi:C1A family cysteine protease
MNVFGWLPDYPDNRDYTKDSQEITALIRGKSKQLTKIDLREYCSPIVNQGNLGSCTANAASGILEFFQKKAFGSYSPVSRLFVYKATRNLMKAKGDSGAYIRTTMGALALFGAPPEKFLEYDIESYDNEPKPFCYSFAQNYQALKYFRLDEQGKSEEQILQSIKETITNQIPAMFGFTVYSSIRDAMGGKIPFPAKNESVLGGHAVVAVGYDDSMKIGTSTGAFIIRNSWGAEWGDKGYGYLPYDYVLNGLALDWWALISAEWVDTRPFDIAEGLGMAKDMRLPFERDKTSRY